jgi:hypothetical protein
MGTLDGHDMAYLQRAQGGNRLFGFVCDLLVGRYDLLMFCSLYDPRKYKGAYGKSLQTLEKEWRLSL